MPVETRSSESPVTKNLKAKLVSIAAQRRTLLQEEEDKLEELRTQYESKRKALEAEAEQKKVELAAARRRQEQDLERARRRQTEIESSQKANAKSNPNLEPSASATTAGLVKMVGRASICIRCTALKVDCYRAPRKLRQKSDNAPGLLKDFVRCQNCIDTKVPCRTAIRTSTSSTASPATGTTTTASPTIAPSRSASGVAAGMKRKEDEIVSMTSSDENEDSDSDSPPAPTTSASKRRKVDVLMPERGRGGRFLPKYPLSGSKSKSHSHSSHPFAPTGSTSASASASTNTNLPGVASEETLKSILDTMNRNHKATMKLFTRLLSTSPAHTTTTSPLQSASALLAQRLDVGVSGSGSASASGIRRQTPKPLSQTQGPGRIPRPKKNISSNRRKGMVKLEEEEEGDMVEQQHRYRDDEEVDQLASDSEPEVIEIEDSDDEE